MFENVSWKPLKSGPRPGRPAYRQEVGPLVQSEQLGAEHTEDCSQDSGLQEKQYDTSQF